MPKRGEIAKFIEVAIEYSGDDCLVWPYYRRDNGYPQMTYLGKKTSPSIVVCKAVHGFPPSTRHEVAHSCGNGQLGCVSGGHLRWATPKENNADKIVHGTINRGVRNGHAKLTPAKVHSIRLLQGLFGKSHRELGEQFGIAQGNVTQIVNRKAWVDCP
jgi:hypothetical protein